MIRRAWTVAAGGLLAVATCAVQPGEANLRDSFMEQIAAVDGVSDSVRDGDELTFSGPDGRGGTGKWRVHIDSTELGPGPDDQMPFQGSVVSSWWRDGELVVFLGTMSGLPQVFLDAGIGQECYALWDAAANAWDW